MNVEQALKQLGIPSFRGLQESVVHSILEGNDTMVLMATSGGKSLCYMVPALCLDGYTIVVSPLLSLIADQKSQMESKGINCIALNGEVGFHERSEAILKAWKGEVKVILMSPELLSNPGIIELLCEMPPAFVAFDEAHCISTWGQDFRPEYSEVGEYLDTIEAASGRCIIRAALTATASDLTVRDIIHFARLKDPNILTSPLVRHNLRIFVRHQECQNDVDLSIIGDIAFFGPNTNGIIYCQRRKECERLADVLRHYGHKCVVHHSGMPIQQRQDAASAFMDGHCNLIIATIGFGMGINKSDVRFVIHNGVSSTPEAWYQEIGRGGRDGLDACAITYVLPLSTPDIRFGSLRRGNAWQSALLYTDALYGNKCRMKGVMACFGEEVEACGHCDICLGDSQRYPTPYDTILIDSIKKIPDKKPASYIPLVVANSGMDTNRTGAIGKAIDALFLNEFIDYDFTPLPDCPPLVHVGLTAKALTTSDLPPLMVPTSYQGTTGYQMGSIDDILDCIRARRLYNETNIPFDLVTRIKIMRPAREDIENVDGLKVSAHILDKISPRKSGDRSGVRRSSRSSIKDFRL